MYFDRFDIVEAHYAFYSDWHSGQFSDFYARLSRISDYFSPGAMFNGYDSLSENGKIIYDDLIQKYGLQSDS